jgi:hypothetical protein
VVLLLPARFDMSKRTNRFSCSKGLCSALLFFGLFAACRPHSVVLTAPPSPPPAPAPSASAPAAPAPEKRCETLAEQCKAGDKKRVAIADTGVFFTAPVGWNYAKPVDHSQAQAADASAIVGFALTPSESHDDMAKTASKLATALGIADFKSESLRRRLGKPQLQLDSPSGQIDLWEVTGGQQGGKSPSMNKAQGTGLFAVARVATERTIVAFGFVIEPDSKGAAQEIMKAVQSLSVGE